MFVISRHFEASVGISTYCTQPSLPKKRKGTNKSFIEDAAVLSGSDDDEDEEEYPTSSRTLFYSIFSTNQTLSTWLNMVWVHPNHNSLSLLN